MNTRIRIAVLLLALAWAVASIKSQPPPQRETFSAEQITGVVQSANRSSARLAKEAASRVAHGDVRSYAMRVKSRREQFDLRVADFMKEAKLTPRQSERSRELERQTDESLAALRKAPAEQNAAAYLKAQLDEDRRMLLLLDYSLMPQGREPRLAELLRDMHETLIVDVFLAVGLQDQLEKR